VAFGESSDAIKKMNKQQILDAISQTAAKNGGKPLGRLRFFSETGIKESDWRGTYWVRWNDAIRETGLTPNEKTEPYTSESLLEQLALLARDLGHFPVSSEIRLQSKRSSGFPSDKTFDRLGNKPERIRKITEYCRSHPRFEDVLDICSKELMADSAIFPEQGADNNSADGFVYLLKSRRFCKIGRSNALGRREYELKLQLPEKANMIHEIRTDDPVGIEEYWHKRFAPWRKNGEWFDLGASEIKAFKRRKFM
jgi:hypothetical protein